MSGRSSPVIEHCTRNVIGTALPFSAMSGAVRSTRSSTTARPRIMFRRIRSASSGIGLQRETSGESSGTDRGTDYPLNRPPARGFRTARQWQERRHRTSAASAGPDPTRLASFRRHPLLVWASSSLRRSCCGYSVSVFAPLLPASAKREQVCDHIFNCLRVQDRPAAIPLCNPFSGHPHGGAPASRCPD